MKSIRSALLLVGLAWFGFGCATVADPDPWEPMNRGVFAFNEKIDSYALDPLAMAWDYVIPEIAQSGLRNFFENLRIPTVFVNDLLQGKPEAAVFDVLRLVYNSIFGLAGFIDVASMAGIPKSDEDFGQTLAVWGVPAGPYVMMPLLGPYTVRSGIGDLAEATATAYAYFNPLWVEVAHLSELENLAVSVGTKGLDLVNLRAFYLEEIAANRDDAFDYYVFIRNAYLQNRRARVLDESAVVAEDGEGLYFLDDEASGDDDEDFDDF